MNFEIFRSVLPLLLISYFTPSNGYNDDIPLNKWSPDYFSYRFFPQQNDFKRRMPSYTQSFTPNLGYGSSRPSWHVGAMGTMYKRESPQPPSYQAKDVDGRCVTSGGTCLFRGGLVGAAVKLNCCQGSKCVFWGRSFVCVDTSEIELEKEISREENQSQLHHPGDYLR
eukprot:GFUD01036785.1.p1 GENE.GFUD01036785.1~~GFUD01036785.1.p1  ORF type:complete len:168 (+),score=27.14 GFUD01036785.1:87-590(+)